LKLCSLEVRINIYCILEMKIKSKLRNETKVLAYFIRHSPNWLPRFVTARIPFVLTNFDFIMYTNCRSQCPRGLRSRSAAANLMRLSVRIPLWKWMSVCCQCCVLLSRDLCDELITRPEESYRL